MNPYQRMSPGVYRGPNGHMVRPQGGMSPMSSPQQIAQQGNYWGADQHQQQQMPQPQQMRQPMPMQRPQQPGGQQLPQQPMGQQGPPSMSPQWAQQFQGMNRMPDPGFSGGMQGQQGPPPPGAMNGMLGPIGNPNQQAQQAFNQGPMQNKMPAPIQPGMQNQVVNGVQYGRPQGPAVGLMSKPPMMRGD